MFWESVDVPLDQIERIEVVRGPGGASWGANAVNGVISMITKSAADTQGVAASLGAGTFDGLHGRIRYGGMLGPVAYRLSSAWAGRGQSRLDASKSANDAWESQTHLALGPRVQLDALLFHTGALVAGSVPAYTRADARLEVPLTRRLSLAVAGQNLVDPRHAEYAGSGAIVDPTLMPRSARIELTWRH